VTYNIIKILIKECFIYNNNILLYLFLFVDFFYTNIMVFIKYIHGWTLIRFSDQLQTSPRSSITTTIDWSHGNNLWILFDAKPSFYYVFIIFNIIMNVLIFNK